MQCACATQANHRPHACLTYVCYKTKPVKPPNTPLLASAATAYPLFLKLANALRTAQQLLIDAALPCKQQQRYLQISRGHRRRIRSCWIVNMTCKQRHDSLQTLP